jgi:hypothetical protein
MSAIGFVQRKVGVSFPAGCGRNWVRSGKQFARRFEAAASVRKRDWVRFARRGSGRNCDRTAAWLAAIARGAGGWAFLTYFYCRRRVQGNQRQVSYFKGEECCEWGLRRRGNDRSQARSRYLSDQTQNGIDRELIEVDLSKLDVAASNPILPLRQPLTRSHAAPPPHSKRSKFLKVPVRPLRRVSSFG